MKYEGGVRDVKSLIVYCSSHGTTEKAVRFLSESLKGEVLAVDLKRENVKVDLRNFETVIIGGSIHAGNIQRKIKQFIHHNLDTLLEKEVGLFLCCMRDGETAIEQFNNAFPQELRKNSAAMGLFGGEFLLSEMNFFEKQIVKKVSGATIDQSNLDYEAIKEFALKLNAIQTLVF
jgi:menaquinone-dependent protoporphyrinogen oxidase